MSFGGGFGGFGSTNNQSSGFGGFGSNNNNNNNNNNNTTTTSGFGSTSGGFGSTNTGPSAFGGSFGSGNTGNTGFGGFGSNAPKTSFGATPFGSSTTGGGLFGGGSNTTNSGFGGFGSNSNTGGGFGSTGTTGSGIFGQQPKPAFGSTTTSTGGLFGGGGTTGSGFGSNTTSTGFGGTTNAAFGATPAAPPPNNGTAATPFNAHSEKDSGNQQTQQFQTITFQQPYQHYSLEELRIVDYAQGRRFGNQNGQAGAFGQSTGFGGFGSTNTSTGFGANTANTTGGNLFGGGNTGSAFGQTNTSTGFGANTNTSGSLFGQKPAGGLFGSSTTTTSQPATGGLFGGGSSTTTGFGSGTATTTGAFGSANTGGGLFGAQNQNQNKPAFGGFGTGTTGTTTAFGGTGTTGTGGFGQTNTTGGGLFGQTNQASSTPAFGANNAQAGTTGGNVFGGFGQNQQQQQNQPQAQTGGSLFGGGGAFGQNQQNQQKPGGLFGASTTGTTGTSLFGGQQNQPQQTGSLFGGNTNTQNQGTSLFGGNKPATTGTSLFGGSTAAPSTTGGGLFGSQNTQQQNQGSSLLGGQANQQKPGGLFGSTNPAPTNTGGGLFSMGQNTANTSTLGNTSLFGSQNQPQQNQQSQMGGSLFGASGSSLQTSMNANPYGNDNLFATLTTPAQSPGPLATPLSSNQKARKSAILPQHKLNPSASSRLLTPQKKYGASGYGFSYSTFGTPNSASTGSSPILGSSLLAGGMGRSLGKSLSTSNLRNSFTPETSVLAPGAFAITGRSFGGGSLKKLNVNRSIIPTPLFGNEAETPTPPTVKKTVSFQKSITVSGSGSGSEEPEPNGATSTALVRTEPSNNGSPRAQSSSPAAAAVNGASTNGVSSRPEMQEVDGRNLTPVPENPAALSTTSASSLNAQKRKGDPMADPVPGEYWTTPTLNELRRMNRSDLKHVKNFVVGRHNIGRIEFHKGAEVDLSGLDLDKICGDIVVLTLRNACVFGSNSCTVEKPPRGRGLNVPSRIILENSWPRSSKKGTTGALRYPKHIERLKRVKDTHFETYIPDTGEWIFTVDHFSSYGLDDDEDEDMESSMLSPAPDTPTQYGSSQITSTPQEDSFLSPSQSSPDDTFEFKKGHRKRASLPGGFGNDGVFEEDDVDEDMEDKQSEQSFLGERSAGSPEDSEQSESESVEDQDMAGPVSGPIHTAEHFTADEPNPFKETFKPKSILKASQQVQPGFGTPSKGQVIFDDDWANQLQRTISPKKQDRQALRESQADVLKEREPNLPTQMAQSLNGPTIATSIDLMKSLFGDTDKQHQVSMKKGGHGIELPYAKRPKYSGDLDTLTGADKEFHQCNKPHFSENGTLIYATANQDSLKDDVFKKVLDPVVSAHRDICFAKLPTFPDASPPTLDIQKGYTKISTRSGVPSAEINPDFDFAEFSKAMVIETPAETQEKNAWELLTILFDEYDDIPPNMTEEQANHFRERLRKDKLSDFWESLVRSNASEHARECKIPEEVAIAHLSGHNVAEACHALVGGLDLSLATLISQIGGDDISVRRDAATQIDEWRRMDVLSEIQDSIRALYELCAGNCGSCEGKVSDKREHRATTFNIAARFGLDWRRAFGLRLWYGILADEPIEMAVAQFADALRDGREDVKPVPPFIEEGHDMGWKDPDAENREDVLWGILKLYASSKLELPANVEDILSPENVSGHPLNARLSFQLFHLFKARQNELDMGRRIGLPTDRIGSGLSESFLSSVASSTEKDGQADDPLSVLGDNLTLTYASSLHTDKYWTTAAYVYTHLSSPVLREHYIRSLLVFYSHSYSISDDDAHYIYLTKSLSVPLAWIHAAAALQAKTEGDDVRQTLHLLEAGELDEAHEVLCRSVGPASIVSRDHDILREVLGGFIPSPAGSPVEGKASSSRTRGRPRKQPKEPVHGWGHGGQIYFDYIHLLDLTSRRSTRRVQEEDKEVDKEILPLLTKLQSSLEVVAQESLEKRSLEERVALTEIGGTVARLVSENENADKSRILKLPLTEDRWLRHTRDLSMGYYRAVLMAARYYPGFIPGETTLIDPDVTESDLSAETRTSDDEDYTLVMASEIWSLSV